MNHVTIKALKHQQIGIVGAGLAGRLLAVTLLRQGAQVTLFDRDPPDSTRSCGHVGAGMLAPISELESTEPVITRLGIESLGLWRRLLETLEMPVFFKEAGTLIIAHHLDTPELQRLSRLLQGKLNALFNQDAEQATNADWPHDIHWQLSRDELLSLEPQLGDAFQQGIYIAGEGQLDNRQLMDALAHELVSAQANWHSSMQIQSLQPHRVSDSLSHWHFDWVVDCRGVGAQPDWTTVRGVRGEIIRVHAPDVSLHRPVRLMHPRYPLYIVPREHHHYLIGATSIESEDFRPITMRSAMELLSAAYTVHPGFAEASILKMMVNCRPTLPDNLPQIQAMDGLIRLNGLYRHGFLVSPKLVELVCNYLAHQIIPPKYQQLFATELIKEYRYATAH